MSRSPSDPRPSVRVRSAFVASVDERLTARDRIILEAVNRLRVVSSGQLDRLFFTDLCPGRSRTTARTRVLRRLVAWRVLHPLDRRVGGHHGGSGQQCYALDSTGQRLITSWQHAEATAVRVRRPGAPGERTLRHLLGVSELYVSLIEQARRDGFEVMAFETEPGCWWPSGLGGYLKPDAHIVLRLGDVRDHWWIEHDQATESLPTLRRKIDTYLDFLRRGQRGPAGVMPRVLISTITEQRRTAIEHLLQRLPPPAGELVRVTVTDRASTMLSEVLRE